ncbi:MAG: hypothetical protein ACXWV9_06725, partial [Flavisolibacter sp.]
KTLILCFFLIVAQRGFSQTPIEFNNKLARITDSLFKKGQAWGAKFSEVHPVKEYSKLAPYRQDMEVFLERNIKELKLMTDVSGSKDFREGMIDFLSFEMQMAVTVFKPFEKLDNTSSTSDISNTIENLKKAAGTENARLQEYIKLQKAYALNNGFKIADE